MFLRTVIYSLCAVPILGFLCQENSPVYRFTIGEIRATVIYDGFLTFTTPPFFAPVEDINASYTACFRSIDPLTLSQNVLVLDSEAGRVLIDPGARGGQENPILASAGLLFKNMRAAGIPPESIDHVFLTHGHADHVAGLLGHEGGPAFPNAKLYVGVTENRFWMTEPLPIPEDHPLRDTLLGFAQIYREGVAPYAPSLQLVEDDSSPLPGFRFISNPGHSPGHNYIEVESNGESLIVSGDTWESKPDQLQNPNWQIGTETDPPMARRSRVRLLRKVARNRSLVLSFHEAFPGLGHVVKSGRRSFDWVVAPPKNIGTGVVQKCFS